MTRQPLNCEAVINLCKEVKKDVESGCTDVQTLIAAKAIVRHIASWQRGYQCEVTIRHTNDEVNYA